MAETPTAPTFDRGIVEGSIRSAVWRIAWPTLFTNLVAGLQGVVDQAVVGHYIGYHGNAALGVSWQIFVVIVVFVTSVSTGMGVLVTRFAGAGESRKVNRVVYQAFLVACFLGLVIFAPVGYFVSPLLLTAVNATPEVQVEALPYLRTLFLFSCGQLIFFMLGGALRAAGDAQTPMRLGFLMTMLNLVLSVTFVRGLGFIPAFGTQGAGIGTVAANWIVAGIGLFLVARGRLAIRFALDSGVGPNWKIISALMRFGLPTGIQGISVNLGGAILMRFIGSLDASAEAQAAFTIAHGHLFAFVSWTGIAMMAAAATVAGQSLGARDPERAARVPIAAILVGLTVTVPLGFSFVFFPARLLGIFGVQDPQVLVLGEQLLAYLSVSSVFLIVSLCYTGALQGTGDTRSPLIVTLVSQLGVPLGLCTFFTYATGLSPGKIWFALVLGHLMRCLLSIHFFQRGKWRGIQVDLSETFSAPSGIRRLSRSQIPDRSAIMSPPTAGEGELEDGGKRLGSGTKGT